MTDLLYCEGMATGLKTTSPRRSFLGSCGWPSGWQFVWAIVFGVTSSVGLALLKHLKLPGPVRYLMPAIPLLAGVQYMLVLVRDMRRQQDELQLRIYLEAAAVVVCGLFIVMICYPLLEMAHLVGPLDSLYVLGLIVVLGIVGYVSGVRRYR